MKELWPLKMAGSTHNDKVSQQEDQNLQQHRCQNITYLKFRCLRSHSYHQMTCAWCHLLFTLSSVLFLLAVLQSHLYSTHHSTFSYSDTSQVVYCNTRHILSAFVFKNIRYSPVYAIRPISAVTCNLHVISLETHQLFSVLQKQFS